MTPILLSDSTTRQIGSFIPGLIESGCSTIEFNWNDYTIMVDAMLCNLPHDGVYYPHNNSIKLRNNELALLSDDVERNDSIRYALETNLQHECIHAIQNVLGELDDLSYSINGKKDYWELPVEFYPQVNDFRRHLWFKINSTTQHFNVNHSELIEYYLTGDIQYIRCTSPDIRSIIRQWIRPPNALAHFRAVGGQRWDLIQSILRGDYHYV